ncbi:MAG TPA: sigma 54-interacting transcriptional regulator, partial [Polyangiaceae bacterium]
GSDVRRGALEAAGRGTVVLDDVVELPFSLQQELAQTLLTRRLRPPGSATELTLRTRIVATSRRDLRLETAQGRFSQDLYDKFGGQVFRVPPLRDRPEDILSVVEHWVALAKRRGDVPSSFTISSETVSALLNQDWAANASELEAAVEWALRAASRRAGGDLLPRDLPSPRAASSALTSEFDPALTYRQVRSGFEADFERRYVSWLLSRHQGNISAAAREARMDRKHLYDLARKHGLRQRSGGSPE